VRSLLVDGFTLVRGALSFEKRSLLASATEALYLTRPGSRCLLSHAWCRDLATETREQLAGLVPQSYAAIQCTYFEKSAENNWLVPVHQDLSVPVAGPRSVPGWGPWSTKEGITFVQPPLALLERLVAVRLHLDACGIKDGALFVVPGTHQQGVISPQAAAKLREGEQACLAESGDALVFRPLLLHRSSKASGISRRRVLHLLFGPPSPAEGVEWHSVA
jgi:Phytanoyl-CoA dioxygenase (PhyH)